MTTDAAPATRRGKSPPARALGVIFSPYPTYADIAAHPTVVGVLALVAFVSVGTAAVFFSTAQGKEILLDQAMRSIESFGVTVPDEAYVRLEDNILHSPGWRQALYPGAASLVGPVLISGILFGVFGAILGYQATFKQVLSVVSHSYVVVSLQLLIAYPIFYLKQSMASPTNLAVFLPFMDERSLPVRLLGVIDLFWLWWVANLAIGLSVLYKKPTRPILTGLLVVYLSIALVVAVVGFLFSRPS
jgi:hypothetical protein